jgi:hypothetical protein
MVATTLLGDMRPVLATPGSAFYFDCIEAQQLPDGQEWPEDQECIGTVDDFVNTFFGGKFSKDHLWYDILALALYLISARVLTFFALKYFNYYGQ